MNIRELELFNDLSKSLHFTKTSKRCNISASALTRAIKRIEDELDVQLFIRDNRSVKLTIAGEKFAKYTTETLRTWELFQRELQESVGSVCGEISIYGSLTAVYGVLPHIFTQFRNDYPEVHINLQTGDAASAIDKILSGDVDLAVTALPDKMSSKLIFLRLVETPLVCITSRDYNTLPLRSNSGDIDWTRTPLILSEHGLSRSRLDTWFKEEEIIANIYAQVSGNEAIIAMVRLGCGVGVVPALVLEQSPFRDDVTILNDGPPLAPISVGVCVKRSALESSVLSAFWDVCKSTVN